MQRCRSAKASLISNWKSCRLTTAVHFRALTEEEILAYVESGEPMDKAGAYGIQGKAGVFVSKIEGAFDTVVGLSSRLVEKLLSEAEEKA